ncbi:hypothetical protein CWR48_15600 [Oceanobacillus arenosus]|uniref:DUF1642 domain-containing protein n=1 Tax=Oceanobacillus arenosus TaxID=1229153 RepID=A0A3D8PPQ9_9BACI|nr:hypothetical protein [Oceanobacillus arenosus]RDW17025.1 hypothetical protein CWR48_15600 [Oceanobacillus arenosus]
MSEKVKVTKEQAEAIKKAVELHGEDYVVDTHCLKQKNRSLWTHYLALNDMEMWKLARAVYRGYEVEPEFKVGDKIIDSLVDNCPIIEVTEIEKYYLIGFWLTDIGSKVTTSVKRHRARHATPSEIAQEKERRWWASHGREVWELRRGDLLISSTDQFSCDVKFVEESDETGTLLVNGVKDEFLEDMDDVINKYIILAFVENRLDGAGDE